MHTEIFEQLARELAERDGDLPARLRDTRQATEHLREISVSAVDAFRRRAQELGAHHLTHLEVSPVIPDEKHVDCVSFRVQRGRLAVQCVGIAAEKGKVRLVGPFKKGKPEGPCADLPLRGSEVEKALEERIVALIREATAA